MVDMQPNDGEKKPNSKGFNGATRQCFQQKLDITTQILQITKRTKRLICECFCAL